MSEVDLLLYLYFQHLVQCAAAVSYFTKDLLTLSQG